MTNMINNNTYYQLSLNILKALGGDVSIPYPDGDAIWVEIRKIYDATGGNFDIARLEKMITKNGVYEYLAEDGIDAYMPVNISVNVPQKYTDEQVEHLKEEAKEEGYQDGLESGYQNGFDNGIIEQKRLLTSITINDNGTYVREDGYNEVIVEVEGGPSDEELQEMLKDAMDEGYQDGYADGVDDGMEEGYASGKVDGYNEGELQGMIIQKEKLTSFTVFDNGTYTRDDGWNKVEVQVKGGIPEEELQQMLEEAREEGYQDGLELGYQNGFDNGIIEQKKALTSITIKDNGTYTREDGYNEVIVDVPTITTDKQKIYNGFRLLDYSNSAITREDLYTTNLSKVDFTQYDWSGVYDMTEFFAGFITTNNETAPLFEDSDFDNFREGFNGQMLCADSMFEDRINVNGCLKTVPDLSKFTNNLFSMYSIFGFNRYLVDASNLAKWNTSNVMDMQYMFNYCTALVSIPLFDTSNVTNMSYMFANCSSLVTIPQFDTSSVTDTSYMFAACASLESIPLLDFGKVVNLGYIFGFSRNEIVTHLGGFKDLGKVSSISGTNSSSFLPFLPNITKESVLNVLNNLYDRKSNGLSVLTLKLHANHLAMLSDEEKAIATNKGWTLS